eukprot:3072064-Prymnesium_polylepis.1
MNVTARPASSSRSRRIDAIARHATRPAVRRRCSRCSPTDRTALSRDDRNACPAAHDDHARHTSRPTI